MATPVSNQSSPIPDSYEDILHMKVMANVATIGPHGEPHVTPMWFDWDGQSVRLSTKTSRQKARNLAREPRIAVSIMDPEHPGRHLEIRGKAEIVDDPNNAFINSLMEKYTGETVYPWDQPSDVRVIIMVRPEHSTYQG